MDFSDALRIIRNGGRARRRLWAELGGRAGDYIELKDVPALGGVLAGPVFPGGHLVLFSGAQWDILATDWEEA